MTGRKDRIPLFCFDSDDARYWMNIEKLSNGVRFLRSLRTVLRLGMHLSGFVKLRPDKHRDRPFPKGDENQKIK